MGKLKIIVSRRPKKCSICKGRTYKQLIFANPTHENFYIDFNKLRCLYCGYTKNGELKESDIREAEVEENFIKEMENKYLESEERRKINKRGYFNVISMDTKEHYKTYATCIKCDYDLDNWLLKGDKVNLKRNQDGVVMICPRCKFEYKNCTIIWPYKNIIL